MVIGDDIIRAVSAQPHRLQLILPGLLYEFAKHLMSLGLISRIDAFFSCEGTSVLLLRNDKRVITVDLATDPDRWMACVSRPVEAVVSSWMPQIIACTDGEHPTADGSQVNWLWLSYAVLERSGMWADPKVVGMLARRKRILTEAERASDWVNMSKAESIVDAVIAYADGDERRLDFCYRDESQLTDPPFTLDALLGEGAYAFIPSSEWISWACGEFRRMNPNDSRWS